MKVLSLPEPWAVMVCIGMMDIICLPWRPDEIPGRILIHADSTEVNYDYVKTLPYQTQGLILNHTFMGNLLTFDQLPRDAIVGYATVTGFRHKTDSIWDRDAELIKWMVEDAWLFDKTIFNIHSTQKYFDYDMKEDDFPSSFIPKLKEIHIEDGKLILPADDYYIDEIDNKVRDDWFYYDEPKQTDILLTEELVLSAKTVVLESSYRRAEYKLKRPVFRSPLLDNDNNPIRIKWDGVTEEEWFSIEFRLGKKLKEVYHRLPDEWAWQASTISN